MKDYDENSEFVGYRFKLYPTEEQKEIFKKYFGVSRFVYNLGIQFQEDHYKKFLLGKEEKATLKFLDIVKLFTEFKKQEEYKWLNEYNIKSLTTILADVVQSYKNFFTIPGHKKPRYKKKKIWNYQSFSSRSDRMHIYENTVKLSSIGEIYVGNHNHPECIGSGYKDVLKEPYKHYYNTRVLFDGYDYWLTFSLPRSDINEYNSCKRFKNNEIWQHKSSSKPIGMDINAHSDTWIVLSDGKIFKRPNCRKEDRKIERDMRRLKHKQKVNEEKKTNSTVANELKEPIYTKNEIKLLERINRNYKRKTNKKKNVIHECGCYILDKKPEYLVMEKLSVKDMIFKPSNDISYNHRKNHNKLIYDSMMYTVQSIIEEKLIHNNIYSYKADDQYPSSQLCSCCGSRQKIGTSRIYRCPICGTIIDRDLNAAINLSNYFEYTENKDIHIS